MKVQLEDRRPKARLRAGQAFLSLLPEEQKLIVLQNDLNRVSMDPTLLEMLAAPSNCVNQ